MKVKKYFIGVIAAMVTALMFSVPVFADVGVGIGATDNTFHSALTSKFDKHESVTVADANPTMKEYSGGMADSKSITACASCHIDTKSKHKAINMTDWRNGNLPDNDGYQIGLVRVQPGKVFRPG